MYTWLMNSMQMWPGQPEYQPKWLPGASFRAAITSEYLGVGYIIGPKTAGTIFAGGVFSWLVLMPAIRFFGQGLTAPLYPSTVPIAQMTPDQIWSSYIRPIGAGAVATAGLITLIRTLPTIVSALTAGLKDVRAQRAGAVADASRLERDLPMKFVLIGSVDPAGNDLGAADVQTDSRSRHGPVFESRGGAAGHGVRFPVCDGVVAHLRADRHVFKSGERNDDCDADGHLRDVPGDGLDRRRVRGAGDHGWRRGRDCGGQCGSDFAGLEDGLSGRRDAPYGSRSD